MRWNPIDWPEGMRFCTGCNQMKSLDDFIKSRTGRRGRHSNCKPCVNEWARNYRKTNPEFRKNHRFHTRRWALKTRYGLSVEDFEAMLSRQNGRCAICGQSMNDPMVDHCHTTGKIRGILCNRCNLGLGRFKDSVELVERALNYLKNYAIV